MVTQKINISVQPMIVSSGKEVKIHGRIIFTKVVGTSYGDRQEAVARLQKGDVVWLERQPDNPFDKNAVMVCCNNGTQVGFLNANLASKIAYLFDRIGKPVRGKVHLLTGSSFDGYCLGLVIAFKIPKLINGRRYMQNRQFSDWDD